MEALYDFLNWAWERHHNPLSWYIRPLFLLPYCYFAYRKNILGLVATVLALATSMFWFPKPEQSGPQAIAFLEMERQYLTSDWTIAKFAVLAWVPVFFTLLGWAFWRRSWIIGCVVINLGVLAKVVWSFHFGGQSGWTIVPIAVAGLVVCNAVLLLASRRFKRGQGSGPASPSPVATTGSRAEQGAAPNGGPATQLGNSDVTEGPPSVS